MGGDSQPLGGRVPLCDAGPGPQQVSAPGQAEHLLEPAAELLGLGVEAHLSGPVLSVRMGVQQTQHQHAAADGAAQLLMAAAHAAAEAAHGGHQLLRRRARQVRKGPGHRLGTVIPLFVICIGCRTAIHCIFLQLFFDKL